MFDIIWKYKEGFGKGFLVTTEISVSVWIIGILGAVVLVTLDALFGTNIKSSKTASLLSWPYKLIRFSLSFLVINTGKFAIPSIPVLILLYWFHYPVQESLHTSIGAFSVAVIVFSIVNIASTSYVIKNIKDELPQKYYDSALLCGLTKRETLFKIELPMIIRSCIGPVLLIQLSMLHNSIFASLINVKDILWQVKLINSAVHKPIEIFSALAILFLVISLPVIWLTNHLKNKYTENFTTKV